MLRAFLVAMEAPDELVDWVGESDFDFEEAWERCPSATWQVWLWGAAALSLNRGVLVVKECVEAIVTGIPEAKALVEHVLQIAAACVAREATREQCLQAADEAETAARDAKATFRDRMPAGYAPVVMAAAWVARAAEGLMTARLRAEAARMQQAQQTASYLGAGVSILVEREPPIRLAAERLPEDAFHSELLFVVAALGEAADALVEAARSVDECAVEEASALIAGRIRASIEPS